MLHRRSIIVTGLALALMLGTAGISAAAQPKAQPSAPAGGAFSTTPKAPPSTSKNLPAAIKAGVTLRRSLSPAQSRKIAALLDANSAATSQLLDDSLASSNPKAPTEGKAPASIRDLTAAQNQITARVNRGLAKILTPSQYANHVAATQIEGATPLQSSGSRTSTASVSPASMTSNCYYAGYYELLGTRYAYLGYLNAYYNYIYYGGSYSYNAYYYSWYGFAYGATASLYLSAAYFEYLTQGSDWLSFGYAGSSESYTSYYDTYLGYLYSYYAYYYGSGSGYAYTAYNYSYTAQSYLYSANGYDNSYCY